MWEDILDWGDKLPRTTSAQHCKPYLKHPSSVPPDQENMQTSQSKLHTAKQLQAAKTHCKTKIELFDTPNSSNTKSDSDSEPDS